MQEAPTVPTVETVLTGEGARKMRAVPPAGTLEPMQPMRLMQAMRLMQPIRTLQPMRLMQTQQMMRTALGRTRSASLIQSPRP